MPLIIADLLVLEWAQSESVCERYDLFSPTQIWPISPIRIWVGEPIVYKLPNPPETQFLFIFFLKPLPNPRTREPEIGA